MLKTNSSGVPIKRAPADCFVLEEEEQGVQLIVVTHSTNWVGGLRGEEGGLLNETTEIVARNHAVKRVLGVSETEESDIHAVGEFIQKAIGRTYENTTVLR